MGFFFIISARLGFDLNVKTPGERTKLFCYNCFRHTHDVRRNVQLQMKERISDELPCRREV